MQCHDANHMHIKFINKKQSAFHCNFAFLGEGYFDSYITPLGTDTVSHKIVIIIQLQSSA